MQLIIAGKLTQIIKAKNNMRRAKVLFTSVILACVLLVCAVFIGNSKTQVYAFSNSDLCEYPSSITYQGFDLSNLLPFRDYAESQGYVFDDASTMDTFVENYHDIYQQAMDLGLIIAIDNDILLYEPSLFQPFFKAGDNVDEDNNFGHQMIARQAYMKMH